MARTTRTTRKTTDNKAQRQQRLTKTTTRKAAEKAEAAKPAPVEAVDEDGEEIEEAEEAASTGPGNVVPKKYRDEYAARGHASHCGDALARALNDQCLDAKGKFVVDDFVAICECNGVSVQKYLKNTRGWQGRLRMSGRNLLRKAIDETGILKTPNGDIVIATYE